MDNNDSYDNPTDWFNHLDEINTKLNNIDGGKYVKSEDGIELQLKTNLPEEVYSKVITSFKDYSNTAFKNFKGQIRLRNQRKRTSYRSTTKKTRIKSNHIFMD